MKNRRQCESCVQRFLGTVVEDLLMEKGRLERLSKNTIKNVIHLSRTPSLYYSHYDARFDYDNIPTYADVKTTMSSLADKMTIAYYTNLKLNNRQFKEWVDFLNENPAYRLLILRLYIPDNMLLGFDFRQHTHKGKFTDHKNELKHDIGFKHSSILFQYDDVFSIEELSKINNEKFRQWNRHDLCSEYGCVL